MTLTDYIKQEDPKRMPCVRLKPSEYTLGLRHKDVMGNVSQQVFITAPIFHKAFPELRGEYVYFGSILYTTDRDGNPRNMSCFRIN